MMWVAKQVGALCTKIPCEGGIVRQETNRCVTRSDHASRWGTSSRVIIASRCLRHTHTAELNRVMPFEKPAREWVSKRMIEPRAERSEAAGYKACAPGPVAGEGPCAEMCKQGLVPRRSEGSGCGS